MSLTYIFADTYMKMCLLQLIWRGEEESLCPQCYHPFEAQLLYWWMEKYYIEHTSRFSSSQLCWTMEMASIYTAISLGNLRFYFLLKSQFFGILVVDWYAMDVMDITCYLPNCFWLPKLLFWPKFLYQLLQPGGSLCKSPIIPADSVVSIAIFG